MHSCSVAQQMLSLIVKSVLSTELNTSEQHSSYVELCLVQRFTGTLDSSHVWKLSNTADFFSWPKPAFNNIDSL